MASKCNSILPYHISNPMHKYIPNLSLSDPNPSPFSATQISYHCDLLSIVGSITVVVGVRAVATTVSSGVVVGVLVAIGTVCVAIAWTIVGSVGTVLLGTVSMVVGTVVAVCSFVQSIMFALFLKVIKYDNVFIIELTKTPFTKIQHS